MSRKGNIKQKKDEMSKSCLFLYIDIIVNSMFSTMIIICKTISIAFLY